MERFRANFSWSKSADQFKARVQTNDQKQKQKAAPEHRKVPIVPSDHWIDSSAYPGAPAPSLIDTFFPTSLDEARRTGPN